MTSEFAPESFVPVINTVTDCIKERMKFEQKSEIVRYSGKPILNLDILTKLVQEHGTIEIYFWDLGKQLFSFIEGEETEDDWKDIEERLDPRDLKEDEIQTIYRESGYTDGDYIVKRFSHNNLLVDVSYYDDFRKGYSDPMIFRLVK